MTVERTQLLQTTHRKMLRMIVGTPRRCLSDSPGDNVSETWVEWIGRATEIAEKEAKKVGMHTWVEAQKKRKDKSLKKVEQCQDSRWSKRILEWVPVGKRGVGRPLTRWTDAWMSDALVKINPMC